MTKQDDCGESAPANPGKAIILLSDGTGNSSAKLFKTNVWRMYQAVDLGPAESGKVAQIAFYDNGVGSSGIRPLRALSAVFGFGLKRNILDIYRFLARNYEAGDRIYAFGFSRGAFTIRLLVAMICNQGVVAFDSERELAVRSVDAWREFNRHNHATVPILTALGRRVRDGWIAAKRALFGQAFKARAPEAMPDIEFVGVWDTVAAYGGPIVEITRGIDTWIWPLTMTDHCLSPKVKAARHAMSLDDERDAFQPVPWDEFCESLQADKAERAAAEAQDEEERALHAALAEKHRTRLQQVWFAGVHADVGGGYPDESLSYVSLLWMMDGAREAGLRLLERRVSNIKASANPLGPIHDSRAGMAAYYRYQPRKIAALLHPKSLDGPGHGPEHAKERRKSQMIRQTRILRDPTWGEKAYQPQGLLLSCKVHESVMARIMSGTDDYAPIGLPEEFTVEPPPGGLAGRVPPYDPATLSNIEAVHKERADHQEAAFDSVWMRRLWYFITVWATLMLVVLPGLSRWDWVPNWLKNAILWPTATDARWIVRNLTGWIGELLPSFLDPWFLAFQDYTGSFAALIALILFAMGMGVRQERRVRDRSREIWRAAMTRGVPERPTRSVLRSIRNSDLYQMIFQFLKWRILPHVFGLLLLAFLFYLALVLATQGYLLLTREDSCEGSQASAPVAGGPITFRTDAPCNPTGIVVEAKHRYRVTFRINETWRDGAHIVALQTGPAEESEADLALGLSADKMGLAGYLGLPLRRVVYGRWLEPYYAIRHQGGVAIFSLKLQRHAKDPALYTSEFTAREGGDLFLFANEAVLPFSMSFFYQDRQIPLLGRTLNVGNSGTATVVVVDQEIAAQ